MLITQWWADAKQCLHSDQDFSASQTTPPWKRLGGAQVLAQLTPAGQKDIPDHMVQHKTGGKLLGNSLGGQHSASSEQLHSNYLCIQITFSLLLPLPFLSYFNPHFSLFFPQFSPPSHKGWEVSELLFTYFLLFSFFFFFLSSLLTFLFAPIYLSLQLNHNSTFPQRDTVGG